MTKLSELFGLNERIVRTPSDPSRCRWPELLGVELELEGVSNYRNVEYWSTHEDGSLRDGVELVLTHPLTSPTLDVALGRYYDAAFETKNTSRTSTHIHVNMTDATVGELRSMVMLMYMLEDGLFNAVGESRKWSGYAMALPEMHPQRMRSIMTETDYGRLMEAISPSRNQERYYGLNTSIRRHGTVEFRYFPGGPTKEELESWLDFVVIIKRLSREFTVDSLTDQLTTEQAVASFVQANLGNYWADTLLRNDSLANMFAKFSEVAAYVLEPVVTDRRESVVFLTPTLLKFIKKNYVSQEGGEYLDKIRNDLQVVTISEWFSHFNQARRLSGDEDVEESLGATEAEVDSTIRPYGRPARPSRTTTSRPAIDTEIIRSFTTEF